MGVLESALGLFTMGNPGCERGNLATVSVRKSNSRGKARYVVEYPLETPVMGMHRASTVSSGTMYIFSTNVDVFYSGQYATFLDFRSLSIVQ